MADDIRMNLGGKDGREIVKLFAAVADPTPALQDFGEYKVRAIKKSFPMIGRNEPSQPFKPPARRSGTFSQRVIYELGLDAMLEIGTKDVRGALQHFGGTIRPRRAKFLTVPIHKDARGKRARDFSNLSLIPRVGRPSLLVRKYATAKKGVEKRWDLMFVLLKSVTIRPHPWLYFIPQDTEQLLAALKRQWERAA